MPERKQAGSLTSQGGAQRAKRSEQYLDLLGCLL